MKNNDALKKHHFWILAILAPLFVFLAVIFLFTGVDSAISAQKKDIDDRTKAIVGGKAVGKGAITDIATKMKMLEEKKTKLWEENWKLQTAANQLYTWPQTADGLYSRYDDLKFGTALKGFDESAAERFRQQGVYEAMHVAIANKVTPTKIPNGWKNTLRWVSNWGEKKPESRQMWLVMEDFWIQRALLEPIKVVNDSLSRFDMDKPDNQLPPPNQRKFKSRIWELDLEVKDQPNGGRKFMTGKIKNRTKQLQLLGSGNTMTLRIWFDATRLDLPPFEFQIQGEFVPGEEAIAIPPLPSHVFAPGTNFTEIAKVEQILDEKTVPIRRLDRLALGYPSAKYYTTALNNPRFWPDPDATAATTAAAPAGGPMGEGMMMGPGPVVGNNSGGGDLAGTMRPGEAGAMTLTKLADGNKKRYVDVTDQVRRMQVAFTVVVDQQYITDVMIAYANSPLRFECVQYHWKRASLPTSPSSGGSVASGQSSDEGGSSITGSVGVGLDSSPYGPMGQGPMGIGRPSGGESKGFGGNQFGGIPGLSATSLSNVSEAQANSGLVELTVYGLISLYEKYDPKPKDGAETSQLESAGNKTAPLAPEAVKPTETTPMPVAPAKPSDAPKAPGVETPKATEPAPKPATPPMPEAPKPVTLPAEAPKPPEAPKPATPPVPEAPKKN